MKYLNEIICLGDIMIEFIINTPSLPQANTTVIIDSFKHSPGGPSVNISWYLSNLGWKATIVGPCGINDKNFILDALSSSGIKDSGIIQIDNKSDYLFTIIAKKQYHSIYARTKLDESIYFEIKQKCGSPNFLLLTGSRHPIIRQASVDIALDFKGSLLVFNPSYAIYNYTEDELVKLIKKADINSFNEDEAKFACEIIGVKNFNELYDFIGGLMIITVGEAGVIVYTKEGKNKMRSYADSCVNPIGAGDAFLAGFLHSEYNKRNISDSILYGSIMAAFVTESPNVRIPITEQEINNRINEI